ncbi:MAG: hypothetical protein ACLTZT_16005 [Butyricimonas faecalis]
MRGVVFEMAHREPSTLVYWHIDDQFLGTTRYHHQLEVNVTPGRHTFTSWMRREICYGRVLLSWTGKRIINELMFVGL